MIRFHRKNVFLCGLGAGILLLPKNLSACASCGCTLSSDWGSLGWTTNYGFKADFRYDYLNQDRLWSGTNSISAAAASKVTHDGDPQEVEKYTRNDYFTLGLEYNASPRSGLNVQLPYIIRTHRTLGTASDGETAGDGGGQYKSKTYGLGDAKAVGRYQSFIPALRNLGVMLGAKLPTGSHSETGTSTDASAPGSADIDRGLQPGSGTTDLILGLYYFDGLARYWNYFAQVLYQRALYMQDHYRPGDGVNLNLGIRYMRFEHAQLQLQFNGRTVRHDEGADSDPTSTGGTLAYLSPGVVAPIGSMFDVYGFTQVPVFQDLRGVQLVPYFSASIGVRTAF